MNRRDQYVPDIAASDTHKLMVVMTAYTSLVHLQARRNTTAMGSGREVPLPPEKLLQLIAVESHFSLRVLPLIGSPYCTFTNTWILKLD